jgi:hypothetical protein
MSLNQRVTAEFSTCTPSAPHARDLSIQTICFSRSQIRLGPLCKNTNNNRFERAEITPASVQPVSSLMILITHTKVCVDSRALSS